MNPTLIGSNEMLHGAQDGDFLSPFFQQSARRTHDFLIVTLVQAMNAIIMQGQLILLFGPFLLHVLLVAITNFPCFVGPGNE